MDQSVLDSITIWGFFWTMIGTLVSIISAIIAYKQYIKAKNASQSATEAASFILERKQSIELMDFLKEIQSLERVAISYTINTQGRNTDKYIQRIQILLSQLNAAKSKIDINKPLRQELDEVYDNLNEYSMKIKQDEDFVYQKCLEYIRVLISSVNKAANNNIYK